MRRGRRRRGVRGELVRGYMHEHFEHDGKFWSVGYEYDFHEVTIDNDGMTGSRHDLWDGTKC